MLPLNRWVGRHSFFIILGLGGIHPDESRNARRWGKIFGYALLLIAILLLIEWQIPILDQATYRHILIINLIVWIFFVVELGLLLTLVKNRWRFLLQNWLLPIVVLLGWPIFIDISSDVTFLRLLRPILAIIFILASMRLLVSFFIDGRLRTTLLATFIIVVIFGLLVAGVDPNIKSAWDGIWWALATVSTVGYGDVVPSSFVGRLIGALLVILGLGVFVVITANFLALTLRKEAEQLKEEEREVTQVLEEVDKIRTTQLEILHMLQKLDRQIHEVNTTTTTPSHHKHPK